MRLIDAELLHSKLFEIGCHKSKLHPMDVMKMIEEEEPTAYDIDKVVEELEIERKTANNTYNSFNMDVDLGRVFGLEKAIEIVKHGGKERI